MKHKKSFVTRIGAGLRLFLAWLMLTGNPGAFLGALFSTPLRIGLTTFIGSMILSTKAFARSVRHKVDSRPQVVFPDLSKLDGDPADGQLEQFRYLGAPFIPTQA